MNEIEGLQTNVYLFIIEVFSLYETRVHILTICICRFRNKLFNIFSLHFGGKCVVPPAARKLSIVRSVRFGIFSRQIRIIIETEKKKFASRK